MTMATEPAILSRVAPSLATLTPLSDATYEGEKAQTERPVFGYIRKKNGDITVDALDTMTEIKYRLEGWEPLPQYGRFDLTIEYVANHPFELLFMRNGAAEMPVRQVIEMGFHLEFDDVDEMRKRGLIIPGCLRAIDQNHRRHTPNCWTQSYRVNFPQLEGVDARPWPCTMCARILPTKEARDQHETVMHQDEKSDMRSGNALAEAMLRGLKGATPTAVAPAQTDNDLATTALALLAGEVGLNKKQREALAKLGITFEGDEEEELPDGND